MEFETFKIENEIHKIFEQYMATKSYTNTNREKEAEAFLNNWFSYQNYFKKHPELWGKHAIENDIMERHVVWGMVKGQSPETIVLIHHYDVVDAIDFGAAEPYAHDLQHIQIQLEQMIHKFDTDALTDLKNDEWQFGRGAADMKAGGAIQMALLKAYSIANNLNGNLILCCLPDEENLSGGMRSAISLLVDLKQKYGLKYRLMIDSEPHERPSQNTGVIYEGAVGKIMPIIYARGCVAHTGKIYEGLNPIHLLSEMFIQTELNMDFSDQVSGETAPPPSWLYFRDKKPVYDVSIPTAACAYMSILTLTSSPDLILNQLKLIASESFNTVIKRISTSYKEYMSRSNLKAGQLPWKVNVKTFHQLYQENLNHLGANFEKAYTRKLLSLETEIANGVIDLIESSFAMIDFCLEHSPDKSPVIIIGLSPPYYQHVSNDRIENIDPDVKNMVSIINEFSEKYWNQSYVSRKYYTAICDLSYSYPPNNMDDVHGFIRNMPLWGKTYKIPFEDIREIKMPCLNIGPWGKDLHKLTERVNKEDLYRRTPRILDKVINQLIGNRQDGFDLSDTFL